MSASRSSSHDADPGILQSPPPLDMEAKCFIRNKSTAETHTGQDQHIGDKVGDDEDGRPFQPAASSP